jgi:uncharacterized protein YciI
MPRIARLALLLPLALFVPALAPGEEPPAAPAPEAPPADYDEALAQAAGADERGMRKFVLVILKSSPTPVPKGPERDEMFRGHFANMERLAAEGKLVVAGPLDGKDGWRGLFILAVADLEEAARLVATDPVVARGEMVPELHSLYSSAALVFVNETHKKLAKKSF